MLQRLSVRGTDFYSNSFSEKTAYKIATIGARGTVLDILAQRGNTIVVALATVASVCASITGRERFGIGTSPTKTPLA